MKFVAVADTHAALWYVFADPRLSRTVRSFIEHAIANRLSIAVSPISLVEVVYLVEKQRVLATAFRKLRNVLADPDHVFSEAPLSAQVAEAIFEVARDSVPDMPDRIIAATAIHLTVPVLSRDGRIRASGVETLW